MLSTETDLATARVLVVEDDAEIADVLRRSLRKEGYEVRASADGVEALEAASAFAPDLVVLDLGLPRLDGIEVCRRLRAESDVPILMLTARAETEERVGGLDSGADDYLVKPFSLAELRARLRALARRPPLNSAAKTLRVGDLSLDPASHVVSRGGRPIALTKTEFALLETLMRAPGRVQTRQALIDQVWEGRDDHRSNVIEVYVSYLRAKVDRPFGRRSIKTVHGVGYTVLAD